MKRRPIHNVDRPCDKCGTRMIGIMLVSGKKAPRTVCVDCEAQNVACA